MTRGQNVIKFKDKFIGYANRSRFDLGAINAHQSVIDRLPLSGNRCSIVKRPSALIFTMPPLLYRRSESPLQMITPRLFVMNYLLPTNSARLVCFIVTLS